MGALPAGTVTFLFTDVEGSTTLLGKLGPDAYSGELARHRRLLREVFERHRGVEVDTQGDAFFVAFASARDAVAAAIEAQAALAAGPVRVRIGLHTGEPLLTDQGYVGMDVHRAARIAAVAHGGQVLLSRSTRDLLDLPVALHDLGAHRLKDLSEPERLYQVGDGEFPPLRSLHRTNLPVPLTPFLGRERELADVVGLLQRRDVRLLSLTGAGGTGKTRLALQAAGAIAGEYRDGVWWVSLAAIRDPELVLETARQALGERVELEEYIGDRSMLFLFDNFEQVVEAAVGVGSLLASCPNLNVLVTSREPLHVIGEHEYAVPTLLHAEAIDLFAARATAVDRSFESGTAVSQICQRLDDLPLAVELAAARVKALSLEQILERLDRRLPLLTGGARDTPQRQRTLRATIEWSHELLTSGEQRLFALLAAFVGGCTLDAAKDVAGADIDTLQSLVDKSLLRHGGDRYWMLETIREFAQEQMTRTGESDAIPARHADYFLALAERAAPSFGTSDEGMWVELLARDHDNFRAALSYAANSPLQLRLACALWRYWSHRGHHSEGRRWLEAALRARGEAPPADVGHGLRGAAVLARAQGDLDAADRFAEETLAIARRVRDIKLEMNAVSTLANIALTRNDYPRAAELLAETEALGRECGDERALAVTIANRSYLAILMDKFDVAVTLAKEALAVSRKTGDSTNAVTAGLNLALAERAHGKQGAARDALVEAIETCRALGHSPFLVDALITAAALVVVNDPSTTALLLATANRAQTDLAIELDPIERDLRASVETQLPQPPDDTEPSDVATGDLDAVLDTAAARALQSLAELDDNAQP